MTKFTRDSFAGAEYVNYQDGRLVARFKYARGSRASFLAFLAKNFTVEEYFARLDSKESPLAILQSKGYVQPHIRKMLRAAGLPETPAGFEQLVQQRVDSRAA